MNKVTLVGRLGQDAKMVEGLSFPKATFTLATSRYSKEDKNATDWHDVNLTGKVAEALTQYLLKGTLVAIEGTLEYRVVEKDGKKTKYTSIRANEIELLGGGKQQVEEPAEDKPVKKLRVKTTEDVPF